MTRFLDIKNSIYSSSILFIFARVSIKLQKFSLKQDFSCHVFYLRDTSVSSKQFQTFRGHPCRLVNRVALISVSLAFGPHSCVIRVNPMVGSWPTGNAVCLMINDMQKDFHLIHSFF